MYLISLPYLWIPSIACDVHEWGPSDTLQLVIHESLIMATEVLDQHKNGQLGGVCKCMLVSVRTHAMQC